MKCGKPVAVRYPRNPGLGVPLDAILHEIPIGEGEILKYGEDPAILALGATVAPSMEAARKLASDGIETAISMRVLPSRLIPR